LLFSPPPERWDWVFASSTEEWIVEGLLPRQLAKIARVWRAARQAGSSDEFLSLCRGSGLGQEALRDVHEAPSHPGDVGQWPAVRGPGVYRREHASLLIHSGTTSVLLDPIGLAGSWATNDGRYPAESEPLKVDAVLITHVHDDHWHVPSILGCTRPDTPVLVPVVPRTNLLNKEDFAATLAAVGQTAHALPWGSTFRVGDIEIDVLPFHGEQPSVLTRPLQDGLRMWGNCYRIQCPTFSVIALADSGLDPDGSGVEVVRRSCEQRGPVDMLLSCCNTFPEVLNGGLPEFCLVLPFERLQQEMRERRERPARSVTLGPAGVAEACAAAQARYFLPYAHGFRGLGDPAYCKGIDREEAALLAAMSKLLTGTGATTQVIPWAPGDVARWQQGDLALDTGTAVR
jgi:hypothetical protein